MKLKNLILGLSASVAVLASCQQKEEQLGAPALNLNPETMQFESAAGEQILTITATRDWAVTNDQDWLVFDPASGKGSNSEQKVTVTVLANPQNDRTCEASFSIGMVTKSLTVSQKGDKGEAALEITSVADFIKAADKNKVCVLKGTLSNLAKGDRFWGFDINDGTGTVTAAFPANWDEWKDKLSDGGTVTVQGSYEFFEKKGTHQVKKAKILAFEAGEVVPPVEAELISVADFIKKADTQKPYKLVGTLENVAKGDRFWGFDINDGTGTVTAAFPANWDEWKDKLSDGGKVTVVGPYEFFEKKGTHQVKKATILAFETGNVTPGPEKPANLKKVTVKEFLAAPVDGATWYELTGKITKISGAEYGNIYIEDATGQVYIYGLVKEFVEKNDKSFASIGLKEGDEVTLGTLRAEFKGTPQGGGSTPAFYISHKEGQGGDPSKPDGEAKWEFTSSIAYEIADAAYKEKAKINGRDEEIPVLKLGKGKSYGKANLAVPAGTTKLGFYAVAWKGDAAVLQFGNGTKVELERGNDGATGTNPYAMKDITAIDYYEIELKGDEGTLSVETVEMGKRAILFGINPVK